MSAQRQRATGRIGQAAARASCRRQGAAAVACRRAGSSSAAGLGLQTTVQSLVVELVGAVRLGGACTGEGGKGSSVGAGEAVVAVGEPGRLGDGRVSVPTTPVTTGGSW